MAWHPVIEVRLAKASDVAALEDENARLRRERDYLRSQYMNECEINLRLEDILREHGISPITRLSFISFLAGGEVPSMHYDL